MAWAFMARRKRETINELSVRGRAHLSDADAFRTGARTSPIAGPRRGRPEAQSATSLRRGELPDRSRGAGTASAGRIHLGRRTGGHGRISSHDGHRLARGAWLHDDLGRLAGDVHG